MYFGNNTAITGIWALFLSTWSIIHYTDDFDQFANWSTLAQRKSGAGRRVVVSPTPTHSLYTTDSGDSNDLSLRHQVVDDTDVIVRVQLVCACLTLIITLIKFHLDLFLDLKESLTARLISCAIGFAAFCVYTVFMGITSHRNQDDVKEHCYWLGWLGVPVHLMNFGLTFKSECDVSLKKIYWLNQSRSERGTLSSSESQ